MPNRTQQLQNFRRTALASLVPISMAILIGGCGSTSSSSSYSHIRAVNACPNGGSSSIVVNGGASNGTQNFFQTSTYLYLSSGTSTFTFTLSANSDTTYSTISQSLDSGTYYSAILFGRADITSSFDARFPKLQIVADDKTAPPSGDARVRLIHAGPDAGNVDILLNGKKLATNIAYGSIGSYLNETAGIYTVQVNATGTSTKLFGPSQMTLASGTIYSLFLVEPTVTTPTYSLQLVDDTVTQ